MNEIDKETLKLLDEMGFIEDGQKKGLYSTEIPNGIAYIDFRQEDGRRYGIVGKKNIPSKDADTIQILKSFKEKRDQIKAKLQEDLGIAMGKDKEKEIVTDELRGNGKSPSLDDEAQQGIVPKPPIVVAPSTPASQSPIFDYLKGFVGNDLLELFGDTGTGKSKFVHTVALEAIAAGKTVYFLDTERNLSKADVDALGTNYHYTPILKEIRDIVLTKLPKVDLVIIDSVGLPILTRFATYTMKERGNALLDLIAIVGRLKEWAYENDALAIVTNQPESEFGKAEGEIRKPFGDKACFAAKEIWRTLKLKTGLANSTTCSIESFRSRSMKSGISIMRIEISDSGTKISRE